MSGKRLRLVFESVDYFAKVWLNDELLGEHEGYFNPFSFEITAKVRPGRRAPVSTLRKKTSASNSTRLARPSISRVSSPPVRITGRLIGSYFSR